MRMNEGQMGAGLAGERGGQGSLLEMPHLSTLLLTLKCHKNRLATRLGHRDSAAGLVSFLLQGINIYA